MMDADQIRTKVLNWYAVQREKLKNRGDKEAPERQFMRRMNHQSKARTERNEKGFYRLTTVILLILLANLVKSNDNLVDQLNLTFFPTVEVFTDNGEHVQWYYVTRDHNPDKFKVMVERYVEEYVRDRETFVLNKEVMDQSWDVNSRLFFRTEKKFWSETHKKLKRKKNNFLKAKIARHVVVSNPEDIGKNWWRVEATFFDDIAGSDIPRRTKVSIHIKGEMKDIKTTRKAHKMNELLWFVSEYRVNVLEGELNKNDIY